MEEVHDKITAKEVLRLLEQQEKDEPKKGTGGADVCVCPKCKYEEEHDKGTPCNQKTCPECDEPLTGKGAPGEKKPSGDDDEEEEGPADRYDAYGHEEK